MKFFAEDKKTGMPLSLNYGLGESNAKMYEIEVAYIDEPEINETTKIAREIIKLNEYIATNNKILQDKSLDEKERAEIEAEIKSYELSKAKLTREARKLSLKADGSQKSEEEIKKEQKELLHKQLEKVIIGGKDRDKLLASVKSTLKVERYGEFINGILKGAERAKEGK